MSRLAQENDAINLGQGFPDGNGPDDVVEAGVDYLRNGLNQYPSMYGIPDLRQAVAEHGERFLRARHRLAETETMVTSGGTEALGAALLGLIEPGDEVILIEPLIRFLPADRPARRRDCEAGPTGSAGMGIAAGGTGSRVFR